MNEYHYASFAKLALGKDSLRTIIAGSERLLGRPIPDDERLRFFDALGKSVVMGVVIRKAAAGDISLCWSEQHNDYLIDLGDGSPVITLWDFHAPGNFLRWRRLWTPDDT